MSQPKIKIHPDLRAALDECGLPWRVENGRKHAHLYVDGKLLMVISRKGKVDTPATLRNAIANIQRASR